MSRPAGPKANTGAHSREDSSVSAPLRPRIALDGRLTGWPGIHRYVHELTLTLAAQTLDLDFVWVCNPGDEGRWPTRPGIQVLPTPFAPLSLQEQVGWSAWIRLHGIALWHAPVAHHLPWRSPVPLVVTMHDLILHHMPQLAPSLAGLMYYRIANAVALRRAQRVICISRVTYDDVVGVWPAARSRLRIVPHGIAERFRQPLQRPDPAALPPGVAGHRGYLLYVGTCKPHKNLDRLLLAYARLPPALRDAHPLVLLVKLRDRNPQADQMAERLGLALHLRWIESVSEDTLASLYAHARAVVLVSLMEGWGAPVSEAMGSGTPAIVSKGSAQAEIAGAAGLPCDPLDVASIAQALQQMLCDDALHARLSARAHARAALYDWQSTALRTAEIYREALDGAGDGLASNTSK